MCSLSGRGEKSGVFGPVFWAKIISAMRVHVSLSAARASGACGAGLLPLPLVGEGWGEGRLHVIHIQQNTQAHTMIQMLLLRSRGRSAM
jgi:hypothetical protein